MRMEPEEIIPRARKKTHCRMAAVWSRCWRGIQSRAKWNGTRGHWEHWGWPLGPSGYKGLALTLGLPWGVSCADVCAKWSTCARGALGWRGGTAMDWGDTGMNWEALGWTGGGTGMEVGQWGGGGTLGWTGSLLEYLQHGYRGVTPPKRCHRSHGGTLETLPSHLQCPHRGVPHWGTLGGDTGHTGDTLGGFVPLGCHWVSPGAPRGCLQAQFCG